MKLASYNDGSRDGQLVVVSRDLAQAHYATHVAGRLQQVLDDWNFLSPQLQDIYDTLNAGRARNAFAFDAGQCLAPLPRAYQWVQLQAWGDAGALPVASAGALPTIRRGAGDTLLGARAAVACRPPPTALTAGAGLAVITGDAPQGCPAARALEAVRLLLLVVELRWQGPDDAVAQTAAAALMESAASAFGPVAVTPDELGTAWTGGCAQLALQCSVNGRQSDRRDTGAGMDFHFGQLIAQLCRYHDVRSGAMVGAGHAVSAPLQPGDRLRIEALGRDGQSVFGAIEQEVTGSSAAE